MAAGAAPLALLLAGPATGLAATSATLDDQPEDSVDSGLESGHSVSHDNTSATDYVSFLRGYLAAMNHDAYSGPLGEPNVAADTTRSLTGTLDTTDDQQAGVRFGDLNATHSATESAELASEAARGVQAAPDGRVSAAQSAAHGFVADRSITETLSASPTSGGLTTDSEHVEGANNHSETVTADPVNGAASAATHQIQQFGGSSESTTMIGPLDGIGGSRASETNGNAVLGHDNSAGTDGDGDAHASDSFFGEGSAENGVGHGFWFGKKIGGEVESGQSGKGSFSGTLDLDHAPDGTVTSSAEHGASGELDQRHAANTHVGPLSAEAASEQTSVIQVVSTEKATAKPAVQRSAHSGLSGRALFTDHSTARTGIDHVLSVNGSLETQTGAANTASTESTKDGVPGAPSAANGAGATHEAKAGVRVFDQKPIGGGLSFGGPPFRIVPNAGS